MFHGLESLELVYLLRQVIKLIELFAAGPSTGTVSDTFI